MYEDDNRGSQMLGLVLILIPVSVFWFVVGLVVGLLTGS